MKPSNSPFLNLNSSFLLLTMLRATSTIPSPDLKCDPNKAATLTDPDDDRFYLFCNRRSRQLVRERCPVLQGIQKVFDPLHGACRLPSSFLSRHSRAAAAGSGRVADACVFNTDCLQGMFCQSGMCTCLSNYVQFDKYCYEKINPSQAGCLYNEQCNAVWPGALCNKMGSNQGSCQCPANAPRAVETADGFVCLQSQDGVCPLPEGDESGTPLKIMVNPPNVYDNVRCNAESRDTAIGGADDGTCQGSATGNYFVGEMYDCIPNTTPVNTNTPTNFGVCCPNRAFACIMPQMSSGGGGDVRWHFSPITGSCVQFSWVKTSVAGQPSSNPNNFKTKDHCESYCLNSCPRGPPQYEASPSLPFYKRKPVLCSSTGCDANHECVSVGSISRCCAKPSWVCSSSGGLAFRPPLQGENINTGVTGGYMGRVRYYYDVNSGSCKSFQWQQQAGSFNNFDSKTDCDHYCSRLLCERGEPLKDGSGNNQGCSGASQCPSSYQCTSGVCCPRKQSVCAMPKQVGSCGNYVQRYWYNAVTKDCEMFTYSGCQGNANNFDNVLECNNFCRGTMAEPKCIQGEAYKDGYGNYMQCSNVGVGTQCPANYECRYDGSFWSCCPSKSYSCSLTFSVGIVCGPKSARWYYDTTTQTCQTFEFLGCDGNSNNFNSREMCEQYCGVGGCPNGGTPYRETTNQIKVCSATNYCPTTHECTQVSVGQSTLTYCCPTRAYICGLPPMQGNQCSGTHISRFYFNLATKSCTTFVYNGCSGNGNNFGTLSQCLNFCNSAACPTGESVYLNPNNQQVYSCNVGIASSCPAGFKCTFDALTSNYVCCGASDMGVCQSGEKAFIEAMTQEVKTCAPNVAGSCPSGYLCRFNTQRNSYYCCAASSGSICPPGKSVYRNVATGQPLMCTLGSLINVCPPGYECQAPVKGAFQGYCCSATTLCPGNVEFYLDPTSDQPRICTISSPVSTCPNEFSCTSSALLPGSNTGYCCKTGLRLETRSANVCGSLQAYLLGGQPQVCSPAVATCPTGYSCVHYQITNTYHCCGSAIQTSGGCPQESQPYLVNKQIQTCSPFASNACPSTYSCQFSTEFSRYQCCGRGASARPATGGCPSGQTSFIEAGTSQAKACNVEHRQDCPTGYSCQYISKHGRYQCCGLSGGCPSNSVAHIDAKTGQPQTCVADLPGMCPSGYSCQSIQNNQTVCCSVSDAAESPEGVPSVEVEAEVPRTKGATILISSNSGGTCPDDGSQPYTDAEGKVTTCTFHHECPETHECRVGLISNICCLKPTETGESSLPEPPKPSVRTAKITCPIRGETPYIIPGTTQPQYCSPLSRNVCPTEYSCQLVPSLAEGQNYVCCGQTAEKLAFIEEIVRPGITADLIASTKPIPDAYQCPNFGHSPFKETLSAQYRYCTPGGFANCPMGYSCQYVGVVASKAQYICCGSPAMASSQSCPQGSNVYINPTTGSPQICTGNAHVCPLSYRCIYSGAIRQYYCCSSPAHLQYHEADDGCPSGTSVLRRGNKGSGAPCLPGGYNDCPVGYRCVYSGTRFKFQCCGDPRSTNEDLYYSPSGSPDYDATGSFANGASILSCISHCMPALQNCERGHSCQWNPSAMSYQCCTTSMQSLYRSASSHGCPSGRAFLYPGTNRPLVCATIASMCPVGYSCKATNQGQLQCCSVASRSAAGTSQLGKQPWNAQEWHFNSSIDQSPLFQQHSATQKQHEYWTSPGLLGSAGQTNYELPQPAWKRPPFPASTDQFDRQELSGDFGPNSGFGNNAEQLSECSQENIGRKCSPQEVSANGCCLPKRLPGEDCLDQRQCSLTYPGARCEDGMCVCPSYMLVHNSQCAKQCPNDHINARGICTPLVETQRHLRQNDDGNPPSNSPSSATVAPAAGFRGLARGNGTVKGNLTTVDKQKINFASLFLSLLNYKRPEEFENGSSVDDQNVSSQHKSKAQEISKNSSTSQSGNAARSQVTNLQSTGPTVLNNGSKTYTWQTSRFPVIR